MSQEEKMGIVSFNIIVIASKWLHRAQRSFFSFNQQIEFTSFWTGSCIAFEFGSFFLIIMSSFARHCVIFVSHLLKLDQCKQVVKGADVQIH